MISRSALSVALLASMVGGAAHAEELRLPELIRTVKERNPSRAAAVIRVEAARLQVLRARALPDPYAQAMVEEIPPALRDVMPMVRFQASQMLPWPGKRDRMSAVSARQADAAVARIDATTLDVVAEAKRVYHQLVLNNAARGINREQRRIVDTVVEIATARLGAGTGMHHDVLKMQTEAAMLDDMLVMLEVDRREMAAMLNALMDLPADRPVAEPAADWTPAAPIDRAGLVKAALERRPELREMAAMQQMETAMAAAAKREYYPDLMVGALYDLRMGERDGLGAMIGLNVPLWIGSKQRLDVRSAEARARGVERDRAAMAAMVRAEVERQLARLEGADRRLKLLDAQFLPRAQQTFDAALAAFPAGTVDALELLDALRAVGIQRLSKVGLRVERELALVDLERAVGAQPRETNR